MRGILIVVALWLAAVPAWAQTQDETDCLSRIVDDNIPPNRISGCTAVIQSAQSSEEAKGIAYFSRGVTYQAMDRLDLAISDWKNAVSHTTKPADLYEMYGAIGGAYNRLGQRDNAIAYYRRALNSTPGEDGNMFQEHLDDLVGN